MLKLFLRFSLAATCLSLSVLAASFGLLGQTASASAVSDLTEDQLSGPAILVSQATESASPAIDSGDICGGSGRYFLGIPSWDRGLGNCDSISGEELLGGEKVRLIFVNIMAILTHLAAFIAVGFVIFGGFKFVLSTGNADQATDARKTIINAGIGAVIVIMARVVTEVIYNNLIGG